MLDRITWPVVALVGLILTAICVMTFAHADTRVIIDVLLALGLGGGLGVLTGIRNNVNGTQTQMMAAIRDALEKLSKSPPIQDGDK